MGTAPRPAFDLPARPPLQGADELGLGIDKGAPLVNIDEVAQECPFIHHAITFGGKGYTNPLWSLTTLIATFTKGERADAHLMAAGHPDYTPESTDELYDRKLREKSEKGLGWPKCKTISALGYPGCQKCPHFAKGKSPLATLLREVTDRDEAPPFADPYADFVGPAFPLSILPPVLRDLVDAQHRAMGADPSAIAMAALTAVASALNAESTVRMGEGWHERPILWSAVIGSPSAMKSPIIEKLVRPLRKTDADRDAAWRVQQAAWKQAGGATKNGPGPAPAKPARFLIQDVTAEKVAEVLSRGPAGALMVHDELAGWLGSFERYSSGASSRSFFLSAWNGGPYLKDRVGKGVSDENAEIRVDNLALGILGGIQPDRLAALRDLTSDGLLQRFLPVLMRSPERGDERYPVTAIETEYAKFIESVQSASPWTYTFEPDADTVSTRVLDRLYELEQVDGFASALIGAIGKLKGYFGRLSLALHAAGQHSALTRGESLAAVHVISRQTAEATEQLIFEFMLPHIFGLYDVFVSGGQDRDTVRAIADFILTTSKERLRPSDFGSGVRRLRGQPASKIAEWASRFAAMGWLRPGDEKLIPTAWSIDPGLRTHFSARRQKAQAARAAAHKILKAGGRRR
jgi:hypothetical protein